MRARRAIYLFSKRLFDAVGASVGLVLLCPLLIAISALVKLSSPGPVFYRGQRTGKDGKPFRLLKFRTMIVNAEQLGGTTTGKNDPRVTPIGAALRKYKLDELPQLLNVLRGEMSFVGPRPEVAEYTDQYSPEERLILTVPPGITDLSSLEFRDLQEVVGENDPDDVFRRKVLPRKNAMRLRYVRQRSFVLDMSILFRTVWAVSMKPVFRRS